MLNNQNVQVQHQIITDEINVKSSICKSYTCTRTWKYI